MVTRTLLQRRQLRRQPRVDHIRLERRDRSSLPLQRLHQARHVGGAEVEPLCRQQRRKQRLRRLARRRRGWRSRGCRHRCQHPRLRPRRRVRRSRRHLRRTNRGRRARRCLRRKRRGRRLLASPRLAEDQRVAQATRFLRGLRVHRTLHVHRPPRVDVDALESEPVPPVPDPLHARKARALRALSLPHRKPRRRCLGASHAPECSSRKAARGAAPRAFRGKRARRLATHVRPARGPRDGSAIAPSPRRSPRSAPPRARRAAPRSARATPD